MKQNINQLVHDLVLEHIQPDHICLDATCGNGHDTVFLAQHASHVHALDIQPQAITTTKDNLDQHKFTNVTLHLASHDQLVTLFPPSMRFDIVMYNLGYLPSSDHSIITMPTTTVSSLRQVLPLLNVGGLITITLYTGHDGGQDEANAVESYLQSLDKHNVTILSLSYLNRTNSPYVLALQKIK